MEFNIEDEELKNGDMGELYKDPALEAHQIERKKKYLESMKPTSVKLENAINDQARVTRIFKEIILHMQYKIIVLKNVYIPFRDAHLDIDDGAKRVTMFNNIIEYYEHCNKEFDKMKEYNNSYYEMLLCILKGAEYNKDDIIAYGIEFQRAVSEFITYTSDAVHRFESIICDNIIDNEILFEVQRTSKQNRRYVSVFSTEYHSLGNKIHTCFEELEAAASKKPDEPTPESAPEPRISSDDVYASLLFGSKKIDFNRL